VGVGTGARGPDSARPARAVPALSRVGGRGVGVRARSRDRAVRLEEVAPSRCADQQRRLCHRRDRAADRVRHSGRHDQPPIAEPRLRARLGRAPTGPDEPAAPRNCALFVPRPASCWAVSYAQKAFICRPFAQSGRQDLNLRPPGPQPEGPHSAQFWTVRLAGLSCSQFFSVSLNLFHELFHGTPRAKARLTISTSCSEGA
jgi:hypothetical protein